MLVKLQDLSDHFHETCIRIKNADAAEIFRGSHNVQTRQLPNHEAEGYFHTRSDPWS